MLIRHSFVIKLDGTEIEINARTHMISLATEIIGKEIIVDIKTEKIFAEFYQCNEEKESQPHIIHLAI